MSNTLPRYTCEIVLHRATDIPLADLSTLSTDPYIIANLTSSPTSQSISFRTATSHRTLNPTFNSRWIVAGIPASGFTLDLHLFDEDSGTHDDRLGKATIPVPDPTIGQEDMKVGWESGEREYKIRKHHGSMRTRLGTYIAKLITRGRVGHRARVIISVRVLGPAPHRNGDDADRMYTLGPHVFVRHFSPLATRLTSLRAFKANRLQLIGPVPSSLRHRYVGFAPFVKAMFRARGIEGVILNRTLHKQHRAIYKWDKNTVWGVVGDDPTGENTHQNEGKEHPDEAFARKFLEMIGYGSEGRIYTYVIMLDGEWRFTETGEEFAIGLLSKHTMHSDVSIEIAYSGEFFVRRMSRSHRTPHSPSTVLADSQHNGSTNPNGAAAHKEEDGSDPNALPPSAYELVIDNDSGTYRPRKDLLPTLEAYLARPSNLGALGRVRAMDGFDETLKRWKEQRKVEKQRARGVGASGKGVVRQASVSSSDSSSLSSSDDEGAVVAAQQEAEIEKRKQGHGPGAEEHERGALEEDAKRAVDNDDDDDAAQNERAAKKS